MHTIGIGAKVGHDISDFDVNHTEKALVLLLKLLLIKNLYRKNAALVRSATDGCELCVSDKAIWTHLMGTNKRDG